MSEHEEYRSLLILDFPLEKPPIRIEQPKEKSPKSDIPKSKK
jgi:hypothetical protein